MREVVAPAATPVIPSGARNFDRRGIATPARWTTRGLDAVVALALAAAAWAIAVSPAERVQGDVFRIFYVHLALAWVAYGAFAIVFGASVGYLWRRAAGLDRVAQAAAELGVLATTLVLVTGSLWGRAVWGVWWTWDARLTTTLVLWFVYVAYLMLRSSIEERTRAARAAAVLGVVGFLDVPIVQLSVTWWRTLHPAPTVTSADALAPGMWTALGVTLVAVTLLFVRLGWSRAGLIALEERLAAEAAGDLDE